jgi:hypothetical protein
VVTEVLSVPVLLPGLVVLPVVAVILSRRLAGILRIERGAAALLIVSVGGPLIATLTPSVEALTQGTRGSGTCDLGRFTIAAANQVSRGGEVALNVLMLVPLGVVVGVLPYRRLSLAILGASILLAPAIELTQLLAVRLGRECQSGDVIDNLTGLALGLLLTSAVRWGLRAARDRSVARAAGPASAMAAVALIGLVAILVVPGPTAPPPVLPAPEPTATSAVSGESVRVDSVEGLLASLADDDVGLITVVNGTYRVSTAGTQAADSLWIGAQFARRTQPVTVRAETPGGVTFDGGGADHFGGISFEQGVHDQTWEGFVFANGTPTQTGVITFGGYRGEPSAHHITLRGITISRSITSRADGVTDHAIYVAQGVGGPHDLLFEDVVVDGRGGIASAIQFYGSEAGNPNAWNVTVRRLSVTGTKQAIILWDPTLRDITIDSARIVDALDFAVRYESPGASGIVLANITSSGSGSGKGFHSSIGEAPPGLTFINDSLQ